MEIEKQEITETEEVTSAEQKPEEDLGMQENPGVPAEPTAPETKEEQPDNGTPSEPAKKEGLLKRIDGWTGWKGWARDIFTAMFFAAIMLCFVKPTVVQQHSMENTLYSGHFLLLSCQAYTLGEPERGDIVVFESNLTTENGSKQLLIKRVIALPGETISITGGVVYIDGEPLDEPYTKDGYTASEMEEYTVPEGYLFCMGDNRQNSMDSRSASVGPVPIDSIIGRAFLRIYPFNLFGGLYKDLPY